MATIVAREMPLPSGFTEALYGNPARPAALLRPCDSQRSTSEPYVIEVVTEISRTGRVEHFEFGLDLILDGLEWTLESQAASRRHRKPRG